MPFHSHLDDPGAGCTYGVAIARGAGIARAYVQFKGDETSSEATSLTIRGQAADNPATFTTAAGDVSSRPNTGASVAWSPLAWSTVGAAGPDQQTLDIAAVIQEIVNRPGWSSGNALVILVTGTGRRVAEAYNGDAAGAPLLHVELAPTTCGNGVREGSEGCDGADLGGATCPASCTGGASRTRSRPHDLCVLAPLR